MWLSQAGHASRRKSLPLACCCVCYGRSRGWYRDYCMCISLVPRLERGAAQILSQRPPHMTVCDASRTNQCISSQLISAGRASLQDVYCPCSFVAARRSREHGAVSRGRSKSAPEGHTAWSLSPSRSCTLQRRQWSSLGPVTSAHSKLRPLIPPLLHHCLADGGRDQFLSGRCVRAKMA